MEPTQSKTGLMAKLTRVKTLKGNLLETKLNRCLGLVDLAFLGMGSMLGSGLYVLTGTVAKDTAGPAVIICYLIAGFASALAAFSYAEFGARVPKAGSSYVYTYVTMGEIIAFIIGWEVILEYLVGSASIARAWSAYLDALLDHRISNFVYEHITGGPIDVPFLAEYPDLFALVVVAVVTTFVALGANVSAKFYSSCTTINMFVILFVFIVGMIYAEPSNWSLPGAGFAPFGISGIMAGAAPCFYAYVGFDAITTTGEESKNPAKHIPRALAIALIVATMSYVSVSASLTLMVPYYDIDPEAALPAAFNTLDLQWAKYIAGIGAIFGITSSLTTFSFALPRCVYAMASDGLLFSKLATLHPKSKVPIVATLLSGCLVAILAVIFDQNALVEFLSIGTLLAYTVVGGCVIAIRYNPEFKGLKPENADDTHGDVSPTDFGRLKKRFRCLTFLDGIRPGFVAITSTMILIVLLFLTALMTVHASNAIVQGKAWAIVILVLLIVLIILSLTAICIHHQNTTPLNSKVPFVPFLPALGIFINFILMVNLDYVTWIRFGVWITLGMTLYFTYGIRHSNENKTVEVLDNAINLPDGNVISQDDVPLIQGNVTEEYPQPTSNNFSYGSTTVNHALD